MILPLVQLDRLIQIVQHAANVYALSMMRERMAAEVARQLKDELLEGLLFGRTQDEQVARERAMRLGYSPEMVYRVVVVVAQSGAEDRPETVAQRRRLLESVEALMLRLAPEAFATVRDEELVVLAPDAVDARDLGRAAVQHAAALVPDWRVTVGIGGPLANAGAIARSYLQARRALETGQRFGRGVNLLPGLRGELAEQTLLFDGRAGYGQAHDRRQRQQNDRNSR